MELKPLFAIPVVKTRLPETEALKQRFLPEMLRRYEAQSYARPGDWETDRIHTSFASGRADQVLNPMPEPYQRLLAQFVTEDVTIALWHNVYWKSGEYQERHHHIPNHLSFIHFLLFDRNEHKPPVFYDPARHIKAYCEHKAVPPAYWAESASIEVEEGDVLVFPSYLEHRVPPGNYSKPRVTVSMNAMLPQPGSVIAR